MFNAKTLFSTSFSKLVMPVFLVLVTMTASLGTLAPVQVEALSSVTFTNTATDLYATICINGTEVTGGNPVYPNSVFSHNMQPGINTVRIVDTDIFFNIWNAGDYCMGGNVNDYPVVGEYTVDIADNSAYTFDITGGGSFNSNAYMTVDMFTFGNVSSVGNPGIVSSVDTLCIDGVLTAGNNDFFGLSAGTYNVQPASFLGQVPFMNTPCGAENHWPSINVTVNPDEVTLTDFAVYPYSGLEFIPAIDFVQIGVSSAITENDLDILNHYYVSTVDNYPEALVIPLLNGVTALPADPIMVSVIDGNGDYLYTEFCQLNFSTPDSLYCPLPTNLANGTYAVEVVSAGFAIQPVTLALDVAANVTTPNPPITVTMPDTSDNQVRQPGLIRTGGSDN
jgi:hypothetical protein